MLVLCLAAAIITAELPPPPPEAQAAVAQVANKHLYDPALIAELEALSPFAVVQRLDFDPAKEVLPDGRNPNPYLKCAVTQLIEVPLRDPSICRAPDGMYYLTGTSATGTAAQPDFQNNDGIRLWRSADCLTWTDLGLVWNIADPATTAWPDHERNRWTRFGNLNPECPERGIVRGVTSPEMHYLKGCFYLVFSMNENGVGILKSTSGKAEGPYENVITAAAAKAGRFKSLGEDGRVLTRGATPSLFADDDGAVYLTWGGGWIARLNDDLSALAETPRLLTCQPDSVLGDYPMVVGQRGAYIFKTGKTYNLCAEDVNPRLGFNPCHDTFVATATSIYGPYSRRDVMLTHAGQTTVFRDAKGRMFATGAGHPEDRFALGRDRAFVVPILDDGFLKHPRRRFWTVTEAGAVGSLKPGIDVTAGTLMQLRDPRCRLDADGSYYLTATTAKGRDGMPGVRMWRSRDLHHWMRIQRAGSDDGYVWSASQDPWAAQKTYKDLFQREIHDIWDPMTFAYQGDYYIALTFFCKNVSTLLKSQSGRPEGPYALTPFRHSDGAVKMFFDDDGTPYMFFCFGPPRVGRMKRDLSGWEVPPRDIDYAGNWRQGFEGAWIVKSHGRYVMFQSDRPGMDKLQPKSGLKEYQHYNTYDWMYSTSADIMGPYSAPRLVVPHGGTGSVFKDRDGGYRAAVFCSDPTSPYQSSFGSVGLDFIPESGDVRVEMRP